MVTASRVILIASDNDLLRQLAGRTLLERGHRVRYLGAQGDPADLLEEGRLSCVILEASLGSPRVSGLLAEVTRQQPGLPILLIQGGPGTGTEPKGGFHGYLPAPLDASALAALVERTIHVAPAPVLTVAPPEASARHQHLAASALEALVHAMEIKDPHLPGHSLRVAELTASIATRMGRADWEVEEVRLAGRLHDLGMIAIGDVILGKSGPLTAQEYAEVKRHPVLGYDILSGYPNMERVAAYVRGHHERWDGTGYPDGLADEAIPWGAQILAAAETFDAMTSSRAYRGANSVTEALERMCGQSAEAIDPSVMRTLTRVVSKRETLSFIRDDDTLRVERDLLTPQDASDGNGNGAPI